MNAAVTIGVQPRTASRKPRTPAWPGLAMAIQADLSRAATELGAVVERLSEPERAARQLLESAALAIEAVRAGLGQRPLGKVDTDAAFEAMHHPIALVDGAIALLDGMCSGVFLSKLREVYNQLNDAQDNMDGVALGKIVPRVNTTERDFLQGRDLAIKLLQEAEFKESKQTDASNRLRRWRGGAALDNFAMQHLARAAKGSQALQAGFAAVLSGYLTSSATPLLPHAFDVPYAEFQAGEVGADGTQPHEDEGAAAEPQPLATLFAQGMEKVKHAIYAAREAAEHLPVSNAGWGSVELMERAISHAETASDGDGFEEVSCDLAIARDTTRLIAAGLDSSEFHAIAALIAEAKGLVDQHIQELP